MICLGKLLDSCRNDADLIFSTEADSLVEDRSDNPSSTSDSTPIVPGPSEREMANKREQDLRELHCRLHANEDTDSEDEFFALRMEKDVEQAIEEEFEEERVAEYMRAEEEGFAAAWEAKHESVSNPLCDEADMAGKSEDYWRTAAFNQRLEKEVNDWRKKWEPSR